MAKITGPLHSDDARNKLGSIVFGGWKGISTCRRWVKPVNPMSEEQGDIRTIIGGLGRAGSKIGIDSDYHNQMKDLSLIGDKQSKQSAFVKFCKDTFASDTSAFEALVTEYEAHTAKAAFDSNAASIGLTSFSVSYRGTTDVFAAGLMLYVIAKYAITRGFIGAPYTTALASWTASEITALLADLVSP